MILLAIGAAVGWIVTGLCDYAVMTRRSRQAYDQGYRQGQTDALRQVSGW